MNNAGLHAFEQRITSEGFAEMIAVNYLAPWLLTNALNPGFNVTGLGRELWFAAALERILKFFNIGDPRKGADIIVRLAIDKEYNGVTGGYFNVGSGKPATETTEHPLFR